MIKEHSAGKIEELEQKLNSIQDSDKEVGVLLEKGLRSLSGLDLLYENCTIEEKRKILGSISPENLTFDGTKNRTTWINGVLDPLSTRKTAE